MQSQIIHHIVHPAGAYLEVCAGFLLLDDDANLARTQIAQKSRRESSTLEILYKPLFYATGYLAGDVAHSNPAFAAALSWSYFL